MRWESTQIGRRDATIDEGSGVKLRAGDSDSGSSRKKVKGWIKGEAEKKQDPKLAR